LAIIFLYNGLIKIYKREDHKITVKNGLKIAITATSRRAKIPNKKIFCKLVLSVLISILKIIQKLAKYTRKFYNVTNVL
jgi:hypothetical protein